MRWLVVAALAGCTSVVGFEPLVETGVQCLDGVDNDGDELVDCEDPGCAAEPSCNGCGNGVMEAGEQCDDGNAIPDDGCGPDCMVDLGCGNSMIEAGEECDDGNSDDTDACVACSDAHCGDGEVRAGSEQCDDGNPDDTDACPATCEAARCGDGFVQAGVEQCDDTNAAGDDGCAACAIERCGDGTAQSGPVVTSIDFEWLASSCIDSRAITFRIENPTGAAAGVEVAGDPLSCTCAPPGGSGSLTITDPSVLAIVLDGPNTFAVDYAGAGNFLGWALVTVHTGATSRSIVVHEGVPGAALAREVSMCSGGFDENVAPPPVTAAVSVFEECDDGNQTDGDACDNDCTGGK